MRSLIEWMDNPGFSTARSWTAIDGWSGEGKLELVEHQRRILGHCFTPKDDKFPYKTVVYSCPKKSGKSTVAGAIGSWYADEAPPHSEIVSAANTLEQAENRGFAAMQYDARQRGFKNLSAKIQYPNGTAAIAVAKKYASVAGGQNDLVLWDELHGLTDEFSSRFWSELTLSPTSRYPMRVIVSYAGYENEDPNILLDLYKHIVKNGKPVEELKDIVDRNGDPVCWVSDDGQSFAYWDTEPRMPWQTADYYEAEMGTLRPLDFLRLHRNQWVTSVSPYIDVAWWDAAVERGEKAGLIAPLFMAGDHPFRGYPVSLAVDVGVKQDCSSVVGVYYDVGRVRVGLACANVWPTQGVGIDLETTVEAYIQEMYKKLKVISIVYDRTNFHRSMTTLKKKGFPLAEFSQQAGSMTKASKALYDALRNGVFEAYPEPTLRDHLKYSVSKASPQGFRIAKEHNAKYKIDGAVALAMATYDAIERAGVDTSKPIRIVSPFTDTNRADNVFQRPQQDPTESWLPDALRSRAR